MAKKKVAADAMVVQNAAKTLYANIRFASVDNPIKEIVITSSVPNEGKTTVAYNLGQAISSGGKRVLLVECDMRRRSMADEIGAHARYGIYGVLSGQVDLMDAVVPTQHSNLYFLDAEPHIPNPADILSSKRFLSLMGTMSDAYDFVIFDTPPVGTFVDAAIIAAHADATAIVIRERFARRDEVTAAYEQLKKADANVIGIIMNYCEAESSEYYYAYYNKDGKRVRKSKNHASDGPELPVQRTAAAVAAPAAEPAPAQKAAPLPNRKPKPSPSETSEFTAAAASAGVKPVNIHQQGTFSHGSRFSRK